VEKIIPRRACIKMTLSFSVEPYPSFRSRICVPLTKTLRVLAQGCLPRQASGSNRRYCSMIFRLVHRPSQPDRKLGLLFTVILSSLQEANDCHNTIFTWKPVAFLRKLPIINQQGDSICRQYKVIADVSCKRYEPDGNPFVFSKQPRPTGFFRCRPESAKAAR